MPSKQSAANKEHYENAMAKGLMPPAENIEYHDVHWTSLTAEPGGVDYLEIEAAGTRAMWVVPHGADPSRVILYAHGGGFVGGSIFTHRKLVGHLAKAAGCRALVYEFAYAHEQAYPQQVGTAMAAYRWLLAQGVEPKHIAFGCDSAGAMLTFASLQQIRAERLPLPAAVVTMSAWLDLAQTSTTFETNRSKDTYFSREAVGWLAGNLLGELDRKDPQASALFADLRGLPPIYMQVGGDETLLGENQLFAERARAAGVDVRIDVFEGMLHTFQMMAGRAPEADDAIAKLGRWLSPRLALPTA